MANRSTCWTAIATLAGLVLVRSALGQTLAAPCGLRTDRLTLRQAVIWRSIEGLADAAVAAGNFLHPKLHSLWQQARVSRKPIYVEMVEQKDRTITRAGEVIVERIGIAPGEQAIVLRVFPGVIDAVEVLEALRRPDGLIPFEKLGRIERYAEVVAHELVHALLIAEDPEYARMHEELNRETADFLAACRQRKGTAAYSDELKARMLRLQALGHALEAPAYRAEVEVWRELVAGQRAKVRRTANLPLAHPRD